MRYTNRARCSGFGVLGVVVIFGSSLFGWGCRRSCISVPDLVVVSPTSQSLMVFLCSVGHLSCLAIASSSYSFIFFWASTFSFSRPLSPLEYALLRLSASQCWVPGISGSVLCFHFLLYSIFPCLWGACFGVPVAVLLTRFFLPLGNIAVSW